MKKELEKIKETSDPDYMKAFDDPLLLGREKVIVEQLKDKTAEEKVHILTRHMAETRLELDYERLYSQIWGSQITILERLNNTSIPYTTEDIKKIYDNAAAIYRDSVEYPQFETYMDFLVRNKLAELNSGNKYLLTQAGISFLEYLIREGKIFAKLG